MGLEELAESLGQNVLTTTLGKVVGWGRGNSVWPAQFGLACCAIEMIATATAGVDIARFGSEAMRASPRQSDLLIVSGRVSQKMMHVGILVGALVGYAERVGSLSRSIADAVREVASELGATSTAVALAWVLARNNVTCAIIGAVWAR